MKRFLCVTALAAVGLAALSCLTDSVRACPPGAFRGGGYYSAMPMVDQRPFVTASAAPSVYYARGMYSTRPYAYQLSSAYQSSYGQMPSYAPPSQQARSTTGANVGLYDDRFEPMTLAVALGSTVRWMNYGKHTHTVTAADGTWDSGDIGPGQSYSATFSKPGTYHFYCRHHQGMRGMIVVQ
jgi:plastocyanin